MLLCRHLSFKRHSSSAVQFHVCLFCVRDLLVNFLLWCLFSVSSSRCNYSCFFFIFLLNIQWDFLNGGLSVDEINEYFFIICIYVVVMLCGIPYDVTFSVGFLMMCVVDISVGKIHYQLGYTIWRLFSFWLSFDVCCSNEGWKNQLSVRAAS